MRMQLGIKRIFSEYFIFLFSKLLNGQFLFYRFFRLAYIFKASFGEELTTVFPCL